MYACKSIYTVNEDVVLVRFQCYVLFLVHFSFSLLFKMSCNLFYMHVHMYMYV